MLLPPSEGKADPPDSAGRGRSLSFPELDPDRERVLARLVAICRDDPGRAADILRLGPRGASFIERNAELDDAPVRPASQIYTGVLFDALDYATMSPVAQRAADDSVVVLSPLWGALRFTDLIPSYRLSLGTRLPGLPPLATLWRARLDQVLGPLAADQLIIDLRSGIYRPPWSPPDLYEQMVRIRAVTVDVRGEHEYAYANKIHRGQFARLIAENPVETVTELADLARANWKIRLTAPTGAPWILTLLS